MNKNTCIKHEVQAYLIDTDNNNYLSLLEWWRVNGGKFWNVARVARKWLAVPETSTPSERVFSICGLVHTTKRSNLLGLSMEKQVFCYNNLNKFC